MKLKIIDLNLTFDYNTDSYGHFEVDTSDLTGSKLNEAQRKFAEAVYGSMKKDIKGKSDYSRAMKMLYREGLKTTPIYSLSEETVLKDAKKCAIARACWLGSYSNFAANVRDVFTSEALRGIFSVVGGDAPEVASPIQKAYQTILKTSLAQLKAEATPAVIEKMSTLAKLYNDKKN